VFYLFAVGLIVVGGLMLAFPDLGWTLAKRGAGSDSWETLQGMSAVGLMILGIAMLIWSFSHYHSGTPDLSNENAGQVAEFRLP